MLVGGTVSELDQLFERAENAELEDRKALMSDIAKRIRKWDKARFEALVRSIHDNNQIQFRQ